MLTSVQLLIGGAVFPAAFAITWAGQSRVGAISGAISGLVAGLIAWLITAYQYFGEISVASTGEEYSTLAGNLAAIMTGLIVTVVISLIKPQNFDWEITRAINAIPLEEAVVAEAEQDEKSGPPPVVDDEEKEKIDDDLPDTPPNEELPTVQEEDKEMQMDARLEEQPSKLRGAFKLACIASFVLTFIMDFLVSSPLRKLWYRLTFCNADSHTYVPIALRLLQGLLHRMGSDKLHVGLLLDGDFGDIASRGNSGLLQAICKRGCCGIQEEIDCFLSVLLVA